MLALIVAGLLLSAQKAWRATPRRLARRASSPSWVTTAQRHHRIVLDLHRPSSRDRRAASRSLAAMGHDRRADDAAGLAERRPADRPAPEPAVNSPGWKAVASLVERARRGGMGLPLVRRRPGDRRAQPRRLRATGHAPPRGDPPRPRGHAGRVLRPRLPQRARPSSTARAALSWAARPGRAALVGMDADHQPPVGRPRFSSTARALADAQGRRCLRPTHAGTGRLAGAPGGPR